MQQMKSNFSFAERFGLDVLLGSVRAALRGEKIFNFSYLLIGAALWPETDGLSSRVFQSLHAADPEQRAAATFASAYFLEQEQVACLLSERVVVGEGDRLTVQAAREVLEISASIKLGLACPRCGLRRTNTVPRLSDLEPQALIVSKEST
jgi:hypothetical protein